MSNYFLVTNFWNEAGNIRAVIENVAHQVKLPKEWLFIDDGSPELASHNAYNEITEAGKEFGIRVYFVYVYPTKSSGNKFTIGRAWNFVLPWIKKLKSDYVGVLDVDTQLPPHYFEFLVAHLDSHPEIGCVAGSVQGEKRHNHMPMGGGKLIRRDIVESIDKFWDLEPDSFFNIKSMALGYRNESLDMLVKSRPTTPRVGYDLAYRLYYCGSSVLVAFLKALRLRDLSILGHFLVLSKIKVDQTNDPDMRYYYSKRRILKSLFKRKV